jgi:hypothetical protein
MAQTPQTYANHVRFVPLFHYVLFPILLLNLLAMAYRLWRDPDMPAVWNLVMAFAFALTALLARVFALRAQDRVIRLEERLRMRELLPPDLQARIPEFRFASDLELPELAAAVLRDNIRDRKTIKKMVKNWRGDYYRV